MKIDLVFLFIICLFIGYKLFDKDKNKVENMADTTTPTPIYLTDYIKQIYLTDVQAIRNLSAVATQLQATNTLTIPGKLTINGITKLNNTLNVSSGNIISSNSVPEGGRVSLINQMKTSAGTTNNWTLSNMTGPEYGNKLSFLRYNVNDSNIEPSVDFNDDGSVKMYGSLTTQGDINTNTNLNTNNLTVKKSLVVTNSCTIPSINIGTNLTDSNSNIQITGSNIILPRNGYVKSRKQDNIYLPDPEDVIIYQSIFAALSDQVIAKKGTPSNWDETSRKTNLYNGLPILNVGSDSTNTFTNGLSIIVPVGKTVIWLRILNDGYSCFKIFNSIGTFLGVYGSGNRNLCKLSPDGSLSDFNVHGWFPIPVTGSGTYVISSGDKSNTDSNGWISGIAFSTNPWNHAMNSARVYYNKSNGEPSTNNITWHIRDSWGGLVLNSDNDNNDIIALITSGNVITLKVPVVPSNNDKLFYIIERNNCCGFGYNKGEKSVVDNCSHKSISVDGTPIERLRSTYNNPLSRHYTKFGNRFLAARIPNGLIGNKTFITVTIDVTLSFIIGATTFYDGIYFREAGTIDY